MAGEQVDAVLRQSLDLSIGDIQREHPSWSKVAVDDYFYKQSNINSIAVLSDDQTAQIEQNTLDIAENAGLISVNAGDIATNTANIATNTGNIATNTSNISTNAANISNHINNATGAHAASAISYDNATSGLAATDAQAAIDEVDSKADANDTGLTNHINNATGAHASSAISYDNTTSGLTATNTQTAIDEVDSNLDTHEALTTAHGVTGNNVGTENYAQTAIGGVVLLADLVANVSATTTVIATADVGAAPAAYDQAYADQQTDLINECKAKINSLINNDVNDLITQFNDLLQQMKDAKQMNTV